MASLLQTYGGDWLKKLGFDAPSTVEGLQKSLGNFIGQGAQYLGNFIKSIWSGGTALVGIVALVVVTPVVTFYLLLSWPHMVSTIRSLIPPRYRQSVFEIAGDIDRALAGFLRGQSLVCLFLGVWYGVGLTLIGLNFGFFIGISAGFLSFIPYVGSTSALVFSVIVALVQGWPHVGLLILAIVVGGIRPVPGRQRAVAETGRRIGRPASGLADFRSVRLRQRHGLHRNDPRGADGGGDGRADPLRRQALQGQFSVSWPRPGRRMIGQLPLDLPHRPSFAEEDFLAAASNEQARALLRLWPDWPHRLLLLTGPKGAGKSHLGAIWARRAGGRVVSARDLSIETLPELVSAPALLIEDADLPPLREKELFHLINLAMERGTFLLVTARKSPDAWGLATKDLLSRLRRAPGVAIEQPDDDFLRAILAKLFHDRQIAVELEPDRFSGPAAGALVRGGAADRGEAGSRGAGAGRPVTRSLASDLLAASSENEEHPDRDKLGSEITWIKITWIIDGIPRLGWNPSHKLHTNQPK